MKIISNTPLINRNKRLAQGANIASLVVLAVGLYISFTPNLIAWAFLALLIGFVLSQVGIYYASRWGRSPRPDEKLNQALKGLDDKYSLYHYKSPVSHLFIGPAGVWVLLPYPQKGNISYDADRKRWKHTGGSLYLKWFAQEGLGRPGQDAEIAQKDMENFLKNRLEEGRIPPVNTVLVFTDNETKVQAADSPFPAMSADKLKDFIRRVARENPLSEEMLKAVQNELPKE